MNRGVCVPIIRDGEFDSDCCPPKGGTKTARAPKYSLTVKNVSGDPPASCLFVFEDENVDGAVVVITEDDGDIICIDDI